MRRSDGGGNPDRYSDWTRSMFDPRFRTDHMCETARKRQNPLICIVRSFFDPLVAAKAESVASCL